MARPPAAEVISAIENGVAEITRRVAIFENDGATPWYPKGDTEVNRLVDGTVTIDYNSDERRKADITLLNNDFAFRLNPLGGFYYDKVVKLYRGVKYPAGLYKPRIALIYFDGTDANLVGLTRQFSEVGYVLTDLRGATTWDAIDSYDVVASIAFSAIMSTPANTLLKEAFGLGKDVLTLGTWGNAAQIPFAATSTTATGVWNLTVTANDSPLKGKVQATTGVTSVAGNAIQTLTAFGQPIGTVSPAGAGPYHGLTVGSNRAAAYWFNYAIPNITTAIPETLANLKAILNFLSTRNQTETTWETPLGEFLIDGANDQIFPGQIKLTMRDNTKKLLKDKLTFTSTFPAGTSVKTFVRAIASNGGITKFREAIGDETFPADVSYERDTDRWKIIEDVCTAFDYEVFFDAEGYLTVRKFQDPTLAPIYHSFQTGTQGNLVSFDRALNDSRIYNIINIYGDPISNDRLPYFGQAINDDPNSPTSTIKLGNRPWSFAANYFSSDEECLALARSRLKIMGLESYEVNFSSIYYPWMETGEIVQILDPNRLGTDPTRFLMDTLSMPVGLGPMSGTGKRVTLVGSSG